MNMLPAKDTAAVSFAGIKIQLLHLLPKDKHAPLLLLPQVSSLVDRSKLTNQHVFEKRIMLHELKFWTVKICTRGMVRFPDTCQDLFKTRLQAKLDNQIFPSTCCPCCLQTKLDCTSQAYTLYGSSPPPVTSDWSGELMYGQNVS